MLDKISPGTEKTENKVLSSSEGPATLAKSLSPNTTNSDSTPSLTYAQAFKPGLFISPGVVSFNLDELFVPHSSSAAQMNECP